MELSKIVLSLYFVGGIFSVSLLIAFLFEEVKKINCGFVFLFLYLSLWSLGFYFWVVPNNNENFGIWMAISNLGFTLFPVALYSLISFILGKDRKYIIIIGYLISILFAVFSFASLYSMDANMLRDIDSLSRFSFVYIFYIVLVYLGFFILGMADLLGEIMKLDSREKKYADKNILFLYFFILVVGMSNFPSWYGINVFPYGGLIATFSSIILVIYIVIKYELINKRSFYAQALFGLILSINALEILFSHNSAERAYKMVMLAFLIIFSNILIKSYKEDIVQKEGLIKMRKKLESNNKKLKELDKAKDEFISIAAHQLRTPPTVIKGYLNLIKDDPSSHLAEQTKDSLTRALASNERLIELVEDILNISRIESGKMQYDFRSDQSIEKVIRELKDNFEIKARDRGIKIKLDFSNKKLPMIVMDSKRIKEVFANLLDNAIKYTSKGSINIKCFKEADNLRVEISDSGMGISKKEIGNLFNKFSRGSNAEDLSSGGIGLGIYVGRKIVEAHRGKMWAQSDGLEKGSTFFVVLPIKADLE